MTPRVANGRTVLRGGWGRVQLHRSAPAEKLEQDGGPEGPSGGVTSEPGDPGGCQQLLSPFLFRAHSLAGVTAPCLTRQGQSPMFPHPHSLLLTSTSPCWSRGPGLPAGEGRSCCPASWRQASPPTPQPDALGNKPPHRPAVLSWGRGVLVIESRGYI